jgi:ABC-2 type transport system ATP-binding protein
MAAVLTRLQQEHFLLTLCEPLASLPPLPGFEARLVSDHEVEVAVPRSRPINELFAGLSAAGLQVASLRNKTNRLEELFVTLTERKDKAPAARPGETRQ